MNETLLANEPWMRFGMFFGVFVLMASWEWMFPRREWREGRARRWPSNLALVALNTVLLRLLIPTAAVGSALYAESLQVGLLAWITPPFWLAVLLGVLLLDLAIYWQHRFFHQIPLFWRVHRVHHADLDLDVTSGLRFHPIEIFLSMAIKMAIVVALGVPAVAVVIFEVVLNATSLFNHSNVALPASVDRLLRFFLVTPDMHRVHHSIYGDETNSNYGFNVPWWDRLFGSYCAQPRDGHLEMIIGNPEFSEPNDVSRLPGMLSLPFRNPQPASH